MSTPFETLTAADVQQRIQAAQHPGAVPNRRFYDGDHWQDGHAWNGPRPDLHEAGAARVLQQIAHAFVSKNVVGEVVGRHVGGVIGREPVWRLTVRRPLGTVTQTQPDGTTQTVEEPPTPEEQALIDEAEAALTTRWDQWNALGVLQAVTIHVVLAARGVLRLYVPRGLLVGGRVPPGDLAQSLARLALHAPDPAQAAVITDADTQAQAGLYVSQDAAGQTHTELVALDDAGRTVVRLLDTTAPAAPAQASQPLELGGLLTMYELARAPLITPQVRQQQQLLNLALTMLGRNVEIAGFVSRILFNTQLPGRFETVGGVERFVPEPIAWGAGVTNSFVGTEVTDQNGAITGYATPSYARDEPVDPANFLATKDAAYSSILEEVQQLHALLAGDAVASGESRAQARADFLQSLRATEAQLNRAGRWLLETALALAAAFAGTPGRFQALRVVFECHLDSGPLSSEELRLNQELSGNQPLLSQETAMARSGVDDVDAEKAKIAEESDARAVRAAKLAALQPQPDPAAPTPNGGSTTTTPAA